MPLRRVVVTGLGALTPIGNTVSDYWENLVGGVSGAAKITRFDPSKFKTQFACEVKDYDPEAVFGRKDARKLDMYTQFAMIAADEAILDSGIDKDSFDKDRIGVIFLQKLPPLREFFGILLVSHTTLCGK